MRYGSVCSGIGGCAAAWHPLGWKTAFFAEIEPFPSAVLRHHYTEVPNLGDFTKIHWPEGSIDVLVGGTPCQSFSVAGLRGGMDDPRGNLALGFLQLAARTRPRWVVWENVPGVLSSSGGRDFGAFLGGLAELGYGFCWRVLDAQYFGLAQRRKRVFVVGYLGDWRPAAAVLLESESLSGHPPPRREKGKATPARVGEGIAGSIGAHRTGGWGNDLDNQGAFIPVAHSLRADGFDASEDGTGRGTPLTVAPCLTQNYGKQPDNSDNSSGPMLIPEVAWCPQERDAKGADSDTKPGHLIPVAFAQNTRDEVREMAIAGSLAAEPGMKQQSYVRQQMRVRRLTPRECERLQGFPDDYTLIPYRGKPAADGPRYQALGNSFPVPVVRWIGQRIQTVDSIFPLDKSPG